MQDISGFQCEGVFSWRTSLRPRFVRSITGSVKDNKPYFLKYYSTHILGGVALLDGAYSLGRHVALQEGIIKLAEQKVETAEEKIKTAEGKAKLAEEKVKTAEEKPKSDLLEQRFRKMIE
jgi:hypothetical protein